MCDNEEYKSPRPSTSWGMSEERAFLENLLCQRFSFFLVVFSLVAAGAAGANTQSMLIALLWTGFFICCFLGLTIYRNHVKLDWIHKALHKVKDHPIYIVGEAIKPLGWKGLFGVTWIIGWLVPLVACLVLLAGAIAASRCWLRAN